MEISLRKVFLVVLLLALLAVTGKVVYDRTRPVRLAVDPAPAVAITFVDESADWDWQPEGCAVPLEAFVKNAATVEFVLLDAAVRDMPLVVVYPELLAPDATTATAVCDRVPDAAALTCYVATADAPGAEPAVAVAVAMAYALQEDARPKTLEAFAARPAWAWENFRPVITKEGNQWQSCLQLSSAP